MIEQAADELERIILEGQGWPMKQFQQPRIGPDLNQRRNRRVVKRIALIGLLKQPLQNIDCEGFSDEGGHDVGGHVGIWRSRQMA